MIVIHSKVKVFVDYDASVAVNDLGTVMVLTTCSRNVRHTV